MHLVDIDNNDGPEADRPPLGIAGAEVEAVVASLGLPTISMGDAAVLAHCPEEILGAAAEPLAKGEVRAIVIGTKVCSDQDTLKTEKDEAIMSSELVVSSLQGTIHTAC